MIAPRLRARLPEPVKVALRRVVHPARRQFGLLVSRGRGAVCPCCESSFRSFRPHNGRPNARCPRCDSYERHRLLWLYLDRTEYLDASPLRVLHIAPERGLQARIQRLDGVTYRSADLDSPLAAERMDVAALRFPDGSFDLAICSHVLEHVDDDRQAMGELHRVLRPGGRALVMVPVGEGRTETYEDPSVTDPADRQRLFWQYDHLRIYGSDVADRLCDAGFEVCYVDLLAELGEERVQLHRLRKRDRWGPDQIYDCLKPLA